MLALEARRFRNRVARPRRSEAAELLVDLGEPAAFPAPISAVVAADAAGVGVGVYVPVASARDALAPSGEARLLRRLRHVVRRRVRVELAGPIATSVTDGELALRITTVSPRDPHVIEWTADRLVALVVLHDGCGARVIGRGGLMGRIELPSAACSRAYLAFCYDAEAGSTPL